MAITIPSTAQVVCSGTAFATETWANVFHVSAEVGEFTALDAAQVMGAFRDYYDSVKGRRTSQWRLTQVTARDIRTEGQETFQLNPTAVVGTSASVAFPPQVAAVITLRSTVNSRRGRGRTYLNGMLGSALNPATGQFTTATVDNESIDFRTLVDDLDALDQPLVVTSRTDGLSRKVVSLTMDSIPDTQRGRVKDLVAAYVRQTVAPS